MSTSVDAVLKNLSETKRVFTKITDLRIYELYDPGLLDGLKMTFPNLKTLALDTLHKMELGGMELGVVLEACTNLDMKLDRLDLWLPAYPERMRDVIDGLLKGDKLYKGDAQLFYSVEKCIFFCLIDVYKMYRSTYFNYDMLIPPQT